MDSEIVFKSDFIIITKLKNDYFIQSLKSGMSINSFNDILLKFPEIKITNFGAIKTTLININSKPEKFGEGKSRIELTFSQDMMKAYIALCVHKKELEGEGLKELVEDIRKLLKENGVIEGIKLDDIYGSGLLMNGKLILIAEGVRPINGTDSVVTRYSFHDNKPRISEDQSVNFYEIDIINRVNQGEVVGQWTSPTMGFKGKDVKGNIVEAVPGKSNTIAYDQSCIYEETKEGITYLYSMKPGALEVKNEALTILEHMEIPENVDFKTGNINFEGSLTIKGVVEDAFSVIATKDVEIQSSQGLGSVNEICSKEGSIFIKGGVNGKGRSRIYAKKNIFIKYAKDAKIICEGTVNIGIYAFNCDIKANEVKIESSSGQIIGGNIEIVSRVVCPIIGSTSEVPTIIRFKGINRDELNQKIRDLQREIDEEKISISKTEQEVNSFKNNKLGPDQLRDFKIKMNLLISQKNKLKELEKDKREIQDTLRIKGECELVVSKNIFANSQIFMDNSLFRAFETIGSTHLYLEEKEIKEIK
jgi:uncharacterized protein (DUF342 family)